MLQSKLNVDTKYIFTCIILVLISAFQGIVEATNFAFAAFMPG